jgi:hypothetical protein
MVTRATYWKGLSKGWKEKFLSMRGNEILIKAIFQSIPVFAMGVFKLPKNLCKERMMRWLPFGGVI